jgi:dihydrofolate synthase / folylpolyglutamate synthase
MMRHTSMPVRTKPRRVVTKSKSNGTAARPGVASRSKAMSGSSSRVESRRESRSDRRVATSSRTPSKTTAAKSSVAKNLASKLPAKQIATAPVANSPLPSHSSGYSKAVKLLDSFSDYERLRIVRYNTDNFDLGRMRNLLKKLGNPQDQIRTVHIAGTKGKGSTSAMTAAMLEAQGYKVGLYTSPHLVDLRERVAINGNMIAEEDFVRLIKQIEPIAKKIKPLPSYFDVMTALAFVYFAEKKVDLAVVETGLGGRLDSTNVIKPEVSAITSISFDHMAQLGHTLAKIAGEKAGIFKPGVPALTVTQVPEVEAVLKRVAGEVGAPLDVAGGSIEFSYRFEASRMGGRMYRVCLSTPNSKFEHVVVPLLGEHQAINCGLALAIIDRLKGRGIPIDDTKAIDGLAKTRIPGRMEMLTAQPRIMIDAAHNAASVDALMRGIGQHVPYDSMVLIFGCCGDKDIEGMLGRINTGADKVIFCPVNSIRTANATDLAMRYNEQYGKSAQTAANLQDALDIALRAISKEDLIVVTGSFYLIGEAKRLLAEGKITFPSSPRL